MGDRRRSLAAVAAASIALASAAIALAGCTGTVDPAAGFDQVDATFGDELTTNLEATLEEAIRLSGSSGGVAGVWAPWAGEWTDASGTVGFGEEAESAASDDGFRMATLTTEVTCTILLRLVDAGQVALSDKVATYVDWIPGLDGITLEQLCRHTSGIADYYPGLRSHFVANPERLWSPNELLASGLALPRTGPPGEQWAQSRTGILLLSLALERRTGQTWDELAKQHVFDPLALQHTRIPAPDDNGHAGMLGAYSASIASTGVVDCAVMVDDTSQSSSMGGTAAGAVSSLDDVRRLSVAFATGALVGEHSERTQWTPTPLGGDVPAWQTWGIGGAANGPMRGLAGESAGALTAAFTDPDSGLTVVVALNNSTSGADFVRETAFALASLASKAPAAADHEQPLVELPWSIEQATAKMHELAKCPTVTDAAAAPPPEG